MALTKLLDQDSVSERNWILSAQCAGCMTSPEKAGKSKVSMSGAQPREGRPIPGARYKVQQPFLLLAFAFINRQFTYTQSYKNGL